MKKRKKKGEAGSAQPGEGATSDQSASAGEGITDTSEETTAVNHAPMPEQARREAAGVVEDPLDVAIDVTEVTPLEPTQTDLTPVRDASAHLDETTTEAADGWDGPTAVAGLDEVAALAARSMTHVEGQEESQPAPQPEGQPDADQAGQAGADVQLGAGEGAVPSAEETAAAGDEEPAVDSGARLESIVESLIFAADKPLSLADLKRLVNERDGKKINAALDALKARHQDTGIQLLSVAGGWQFRTHPENGAWVAKLLTGRPARLSRAMMETMAIVAYRQPITRPEIDEIRGVDCGPVLKTLLDRGLVRMIGKREDVGRPLLYGTTPEFLRTFSLRDLTELPTLREFHELGAAEMAKVDAETPRTAEEAAAAAPPTAMPQPTVLSATDPDEEDDLLAQLDSATSAAAHASKAREADAAPPTSASPETPEA